MKFRSISYYVRQAIKGLFKNRLMSLASIITVVSCISILAFSYCVAVNIDYILEQLEGSLNLSAFIDDELDEKEVNKLFEEVKAIPNIKEVRYISRDEAFKIFSEDLGDSTHVLTGLEKEMPRSFVINLEDIKYQKEIADELKNLKQKGITEVKYDQNIINIITTVNTGIRIVSVIIILFLIVISIIIIINTIKIAVNIRRTEITIMKYIGATDWFIRWPFIIEGILIGLIGALIPLVTCWLGYNGAIAAIYENIEFLKELFDFRTTNSIFSVLLPLCLTIGIGIGVIGSVTSIRKHLNV